MGLAERMEHYPHQLSGGQQQRVAIARALALKPDILCFDEPTSALDPELTGEVLKVIRSLAQQNTTMIIVTHEMAFARDVADQVIFMDGGVIVEHGDPHEVIDHPKEERTRQFRVSYTHLDVYKRQRLLQADKSIYRRACKIKYLVQSLQLKSYKGF